MKFLIRTLVGLVVLAVLLAGGTLVYVQSLDLSRFGATVARHLSRSLGHEVAIRGEVRLALNPNVGLSIDQILVTNVNASGASTLAEIGRIAVEVEPFALLRGQLEPESMTLMNVDVWIEPSEEGSNWFSESDRERTMRHPALSLQDIRVHLGTGDDRATLTIDAFDGRFSNEQRLQGKLTARVSSPSGELAERPLSLVGQLEIDPSVGFTLTRTRVRRGALSVSGKLSVGLGGEKRHAAAALVVDELDPSWCAPGSERFEIPDSALPPLDRLTGWGIDIAVTLNPAAAGDRARPDPAEIRLAMQERVISMHFAYAGHDARVALAPQTSETGGWEVTATAKGEGGWPSALLCLEPDDPLARITRYDVRLTAGARTYRDIAANAQGTARATYRHEETEFTIDASLAAGAIERFEVHPADRAFSVTGQSGPLLGLLEFPWDLSGVVQTKGGLHGRFKGALSDGRYNARVDLDAPIGAPGGPVITLSANLSAGETGWTAAFTKGRLAGQLITGNAELSGSGQNLKLEGELRVATLDAGALMAAPRKEPIRKARAGKQANSPVFDGALPLDVGLVIRANQLTGLAVPMRDGAVTLRAKRDADWNAGLEFNALNARWTGDLGWQRKREPALALRLHTDSLSAGPGLELRGIEISANADPRHLPGHFHKVEFSTRAQSGTWTRTEWPNRLSVGTVDGQFSIAGGLKLNAEALEIMDHRFETALTAEPSDGTRNWAINLGLQGEVGQMTLVGRLANLGEIDGSEWNLSAKGPSAKMLSQGFGLADWPIELEGAYDVATTARISEEATGPMLALSRIKVAVQPLGAMTGRGRVAFRRTGEPAKEIRLDLTAKQLRLRPSEAPPEEKPAAEKDTGPLLPDFPIPSSLPPGLALDVRFAADAIEHPRQRWEQVRADWRQQPRGLKANLAVGRVGAGGTLAMKLQADAPNDRGFRWALRVNADEADLGWVLPKAKTKPTAWHADVELDLTGRGKSLADILRSSDGRAYFSADETERGADDLVRWETNLFTMMLPRSGPPRRQKLYCMTMDADIAQGVASTNAFLLDTEVVTVAGHGTLALGSEQLDFVVTPRPKGIPFLNPSASVRVSGPLRDPQLSIAPRDVVLSAGQLLLGFVSPYALLAGFVAKLVTTRGEENACEAALKRASQAKATRKTQSGQTSANTGRDEPATRKDQR